MKTIADVIEERGDEAMRSFSPQSYEFLSGYLRITSQYTSTPNLFNILACFMIAEWDSDASYAFLERGGAPFKALIKCAFRDDVTREEAERILYSESV